MRSEELEDSHKRFASDDSIAQFRPHELRDIMDCRVVSAFDATREQRRTRKENIIGHDPRPHAGSMPQH